VIANDSFSQYYSPLLDDTYDVVDRLVVSAYFKLGTSGGGFRYWWRQLHGNDDNLDNTHLMRMAGRFSRRVRGWAKKNDVPVVFCAAGERKHKIAAELKPSDPSFRGIYAVLIKRAPAAVWEVLEFERGGFHLRYKKNMPYVNHYSFHIVDEQWGDMTINVCGHAPFRAFIMLNGHEYTASQAAKAGITFKKEGNCFTDVSDADGLAKVADSLRSESAVGRLRQVCERWIYKCVCFGLSFDEQKRSGFRYSYSVRQVEYSRNLLFRSGYHLEQVFQGVIDRTRGILNIKTVRTIFNKLVRRRGRAEPTKVECVVERPEYNLTIFKVHFGKLTLKMYSKGERVLRIEAIAHNTKELNTGIGIDRFPAMIAKLSAMLERFLESLRCVDVAWISDELLERLPDPGFVGQTRVGGVDINKPRMRAVMEAVVALSISPNGFSAAEHAARVREIMGKKIDKYEARHAAYDLKKLRGKGLLEKAPRSQRKYVATTEGARAMAGLFVVREKLLKPLLKYRGRCNPVRRTPEKAEIDRKYQVVQHELQKLLKDLRMIA
jgi:DNA-binding transcriptional ArsR family regulator